MLCDPPGLIENGKERGRWSTDEQKKGMKDLVAMPMLPSDTAGVLVSVCLSARSLLSVEQ